MRPFEGYEAEDYSPSWMMDIAAIESFQGLALARKLVKLYAPRSVADIGCGPGVYLTGFAAAGCEILGIDAFDDFDAFGSTHQRVDLRFPWRPNWRVDLALCLEVAEHLKPEFADTLVDTLCATSNRIVFSAATPGQGGLHHYNEQPLSYWLEKFRARGYGLDTKNDEFQTWLKSLTPYREQNRVCGWFIDHTIILSKK